ncbi:hypothetical protein MYX76_09565 [Desulfobacterota bacterium AH_259_B03_O07]|nr:hypothetical protein [Desulfobacterota bacterium AH_259_B03_O07]
MRKIRGTSTLKTDMLFLLIAVSYLILSAASFENKENSLSTSGKEVDTIERVKILVSSSGVFELTEDGTRGGKVDIRKLVRTKNAAGVEIHPSSDAMWRDVQIAYVFLSRGGIDVIIKPF